MPWLAHAQEIHVERDTVLAGEQASVSLSIDMDGVLAWEIRVSYDTTSLYLVSIAGAGQSGEMVYNERRRGNIAMAWAGVYAVGRGDIVLEMLFDVTAAAVPNTLSRVSITHALLNEGTPQAQWTDGGVYVYEEPAEKVTRFSNPSAVLSIDRAMLSWEAFEEHANAGFYVQQMGEQWESVGFIQGAGTSADTTVYRWSSIPLSPGSYQFRIEQVSFSGASVHSAPVNVDVHPRAFGVEIYPSPARHEITVDMSVAIEGMVGYTIFDVLGRVVTSDESREPPGRTLRRIDVSGFASGTYYFSVRTGEHFEVLPFAVKK